MKINNYNYIVADVGSNYTRVNLFIVLGHEEHLVAEGVYNSQNFAGLGPILQIFLTENAISRPPDYGCFSFNGLVTKDTADMPLLGWHETAETLASEAGISKVLLLNNYEAKGYGIEYLEDEEISELAPGKKGRKGGSKIIIGAETGLGAAFIFYSQQKTCVVAGEAGHSDFAPRNRGEFNLAQFIKAKFDVTDVAAERVVSGIGIDTIYWHLVSESPAAADSELSEKIKHDHTAPGRIVLSHALSKRDALCEKALKIFAGAFGAIAGNMALTVLPSGGVYIAGSLAASLDQELRAEFLESFYDKGRMRRLLADFPVRLLSNNNAAILGARHMARQLHATKLYGGGGCEADPRPETAARGEGLVLATRRLALVAAGAALSAALIGAFVWGAAEKGDH